MLQDDERYCFLVDWYEETAARTRQFQFFYFVNSKYIEMFDIKNRRMFLRTSLKETNITLANLYIGGSINVCGRLLTIVDFGDDYTRRKLLSKKERTLGLIKPDAIDKLGRVLDGIYQKGFLITHLRMCQLNSKQALTFYEEHSSKPFLHTLLEFITSGPVVALQIVGENAVAAWREAIGPTNPSTARSEAPTSLRAQLGTDQTRNALHGADSPAAAAREIEFFFPASGPHPAGCLSQKEAYTCCIIKPHAVKAGFAGKIISIIIDAGFRIGALEMVTLERANAEEFLEVYKGVVPEYNGLVSELISGTCIALAVLATDKSPNVVQAFRELAGPADPEIARHLRPHSVRGIFGKDKVKNAVHVTDLPEDGQLEVEYFFKILDHQN